MMHGQIGSSNEAAFARLLAERAGDYFAEFRQIDPVIQTVRAVQRPFSELYEYTLQACDVQQAVIVKVPFLDKSRPPAQADRPRLFPPVAARDMAALECHTMRTLERHFTEVNDQRFGSVRVLDFVRDPDAIVMQKVDGVTLRSLLEDARKQRDYACGEVFHNTGRWLRELHSLSGHEHTQERTVTRTEFAEASLQFVEYLARFNPPRWLKPLGEQLLREAETHLPDLLPLGLAHGDFAPRNVIVSPPGRVTVLDTLARWRAPIYEDIALFLVSKRLTQAMATVFAWDSPKISQWSHEFLSGYFGDASIPQQAIRVFICQALLDRWCSYVSRPRPGKLSNRLQAAGKLHILKRFARRSLNRDFCGAAPD